jgi:peroxiredoxin
MASRRYPKLLSAGTSAPKLRLPQLNGGEVTLDHLIAGGPILLAFFKVTCPICQMTFPFLERINRPGALAVYGISQNDAQDTREFNQEFGVTFPTLLDSEDSGFETSNAYGISSVPTMFLVEPDGNVSRVIEGWRKSEIEWLGARTGVHPIKAGEYVPEWKAG